MTALENCEMAKKKEKIDVARFLLNSGAKVNAMNSEHKTPLHIAANCDNLEIAELLLQFDADPNAGKISGVFNSYLLSCQFSHWLQRYAMAKLYSK